MSFIQKCTRLFSRKHHPRLALFFRYLLCFMLGGLLGLIPYFIFLVELCKGLQYSCIQEYAGEMYKIAPSLPFCHAFFLLLPCQPLSYFCCCFFLALMLFLQKSQYSFHSLSFSCFLLLFLFLYVTRLCLSPASLSFLFSPIILARVKFLLFQTASLAVKNVHLPSSPNGGSKSLSDIARNGKTGIDNFTKFQMLTRAKRGRFSRKISAFLHF